MDSKKVDVLIIDNYPLHVQVYRKLLKEIELTNEGWSFRVSEANSCDSAIDLLDRIEATRGTINLVFLEIKIPPSKRKSYLSGEDIGTEIRERFQGVRILINTVLDNSYRINTIFDNINPEGLIIRSDVNFEVLLFAIKQVLIDNPYYSGQVLRFLNKSKDYSISLDIWDRKILYELSLGTKMKDLPVVLPLSLGAIEKRKRNIKLLFGIEGVDDRKLLDKARSFGVI
ncbi:DNA-binding response regulator [Aequorivita marina]|uniref:DNA-binding response regulator n=1 Tax=Aequorivita marina TaxID=3073654 RepID=UPI002875547B|nr:DNA-binding response regulator [Aequorivita sp. S2608]MDS1297871.1 DNA-binding response regulator [Aequorivita sp. S2608]